MANCPDLPVRRQYIGARYVPKFADPIDWDRTLAYEALTVVNYGNTSYTSKRYVPAGIPPTNDCYWVATGRYNAQVEQYRQEVEALKDQIGGDTTDITQLKTDVQALQADTAQLKPDVATAQTDITQLKTNTAALRTDVTTLQTDLGSAQTDVTQAKQDITALQARASALEGRATTLETGLDSVQYITINGVKRPRIIDAPLTLTVPSDFASAGDAINSYLQFCIINDSVTIKYNDGTYSGNQITALNINLEKVSIIGNLNAPQNVKINIVQGETAFQFTNATIAEINGFDIIGTATGNYPDLTPDSSRGIVTTSDIIIGKAMIFERVGTAITSEFAFVSLLTELTSPINDIDDATIEQYKGKTPIFHNVGFVCRITGGGISLRGIIALNCVYNGIFDISMAQFSLSNSLIKNHKTLYLISMTQSKLVFVNVNMRNTNQLINCASSTLSITNFNLFNSGGQSQIKTSHMAVTTATFDTNNGGPLFVLTDSTINLNANITVKNMNVFIYAPSSQQVSINTQVHFENVTCKYHFITAIGGRYEPDQQNFVGDIVYFANPTDYVGQVCTATGTPGTWKKFGALEP